MRYLGGKATIATELAQVLKGRHPDSESVIEPFCGGCNMTVALAAAFKEVLSYDFRQDLIMMWSAAQGGWEPPMLTEAEYNTLKHAPPSALRGFAGAGASYNGKWFGSYAHNAGERSYIAEARKSVISEATAMPNVRFAQSDFSRVEVPDGSLVYADPPYSGTTDYKTTFSSLRFWHFARKWSAKARVYVSEYRAPPDFVPIWAKEITSGMNSKKVVEKLFVHKDQV